MNPLIYIFIVVLAAVLFIIWWWNRRSDERPVDEPYHANPFVGTPSYAPAPSAPTPAATDSEHDGNGGGGVETHAAAAEASVAAPEAPAATDPAITVPELVLGDEAAVTTETVVAEKQLHEIAGHTTQQEVPASVPTPVEVVTPVAPVEASAPVETVPEVTPVPPVEPPAPPPPAPSTPPAAPASAPSGEMKVDDLTKIEGVGPKIGSVLQQAGIRTFADLAAAKPAAIKEILTEAKLYTADPATWPQQAKLAAAGKWEQLKTLQDKLDGGRKV